MFIATTNNFKEIIIIQQKLNFMKSVYFTFTLTFSIKNKNIWICVSLRVYSDQFWMDVFKSSSFFIFISCYIPSFLPENYVRSLTYQILNSFYIKKIVLSIAPADKLPDRRCLPGLRDHIWLTLASNPKNMATGK